MKPYKHIQEAKKVLKTLSNEAKTMDNTLTRLKELNILIETVNSFEEMLTKNYYTDVIELLLLSRMYQMLIKSDKEINVNEFLMFFDKDLREGRDFIKDNITGYLQGIQLSNSLEKGLIIQDSKEVWGSAVDNLLTQIKERIVFNKKYK